MLLEQNAFFPPIINILFFLDALNFPYQVVAVYHFLMYC